MLRNEYNLDHLESFGSSFQASLINDSLHLKYLRINNDEPENDEGRDTVDEKFENNEDNGSKKKYVKSLLSL
jgi:hypothetical protein